MPNGHHLTLIAPRTIILAQGDRFLCLAGTPWPDARREMSLRSRNVWLALTPAFLSLQLGACGGGESTDTGPTRYARMIDYTVNPNTTRPPANTAEIQNLVLSYDVDFKSDTHLPTYRLTTHILPAGQAFVSADQSAGRIHTQFCGQGGNACGNPHTKPCDLQAGWLSAAQRHVRCDSYNPGLELDPGAYQFVANVCEITTSAVTNCTTKTVVVTLQ
jgi:hypothetical protein